MKDNISFTIPMEYNALVRTADMLNALADDLETKTVKVELKGEAFSKEQVKEVIEKVNEELDNTAVSVENVFGKNVVPLHDDKTAPPLLDNPSLQGAENIGIGAADVPLAPLTGVELDSDGLPWDVRIHGKNKLKLAKTEQWKKRRGVDPALVETVEAELRAAMAVPAPVATIENGGLTEEDGHTNEQPTLASAVNSDDYKVPPPPPAPVETVVPPEPTGITFPELISKITTAMAASTVTEAMVIAACNNQGIASFPLLAVRPDLVPAVDAALFPL